MHALVIFFFQQWMELSHSSRVKCLESAYGQPSCLMVGFSGLTYFMWLILRKTTAVILTSTSHESCLVWKNRVWSVVYAFLFMADFYVSIVLCVCVGVFMCVYLCASVYSVYGLECACFIMTKWALCIHLQACEFVCACNFKGGGEGERERERERKRERERERERE